MYFYSIYLIIVISISLEITLRWQHRFNVDFSLIRYHNFKFYLLQNLQNKILLQ